MKKMGLMSLLVILILVGCSKKEAIITFSAIIGEVDSNRLIVLPYDFEGIDQAVLSISDAQINFTPRVGQNVEISILPEIRETYPVQATATDVKLKETYHKITPEQAKRFVDSNEGIVLDVRTLEEYNEGHIENALLLPNDEIENKAEITLYDKDELILVYCRSGRRSEDAARKLMDRGYTNVHDLGGIMDWPYEVVK